MNSYDQHVCNFTEKKYEDFFKRIDLQKLRQ